MSVTTICNCPDCEHTKAAMQSIPPTASSSLLPCPFCGNPYPEHIEVATAPGCWRVGCSKCGSYNNYSNDPQRAIDAWNQRDGWQSSVLLWIGRLSVNVGWRRKSRAWIKPEPRPGDGEKGEK